MDLVLFTLVFLPPECVHRHDPTWCFVHARKKLNQLLDLKKIFYFFLHFYLCVLYGYLAFLYVCAPRARIPSEVSRECQTPLELELLVVSHHLDAKNQTQVFWKSNWYSSPQSYLSSPAPELFTQAKLISGVCLGSSGQVCDWQIALLT